MAMAIYHFSGQIIGRSNGKSATAAAAYRAGQKIADRTTGEEHDYTRKGGVLGASILAPSHAPDWVFDRSELWNKVEESETRVNSQLAREFDIAIPIELSDYDRIELVREFVQEQFVELGMVADVAFHDFRSHNPHCHIMLSTREVGQEGFAVKNRTWNSHALMDKWREAWADHANRALEKAGFDVRIDHRSYEDQGIDLIPTKHMGPAVAALENRGIATRIGDGNRRIEKTNAEYMDTQVSLEVERQDVTDEIECIRKEAMAQPSTSGTIRVENHFADIADRAEQEYSKFRTGMAASFADQFKAKLFLKTWNADLDPLVLKQLKWVDVDARAITLKTGEQVVDKGDSLSLSKGSDGAIKAAVSMAKAKGWNSVRLIGSDDFQARAALALKEAGIEPRFASKAAKERFSDEIKKRQEPPILGQIPEPASKFDEPVPVPVPGPEPEPELIPKLEPVNIDVLKDLVRRVAEQAPPPQTNTFRDDTRKLRKWARERWNELIDLGELEGLADTFRSVMEEQAIIAGYSDYEIEALSLDSEWAKAMSSPLKEAPQPPPRSSARSGQSQTWHSDISNKPPGT
jgi:hypothetical protein